MTATFVKVALRIRPSINKDIKQECLKTVKNENTVYLKTDKCFEFDFVYPSYTGQQEVYDSSVAPLLTHFIKGNNATVLGYGQKDSGKTYSIGTGPDIYPNTDNQGIIHRFVYSLFKTLKEETKYQNFQIYASYVEICSDGIKDLLAASNDSEQHPFVKKDNQGQNHWTDIKVHTAKELLNCLKRGYSQRSASSHVIFSISMKQRSLKDLKNGNDLDKLLVSKFNFVDLASSERLEEVGVLERRSKEEMSVISDLADLRYILTGLAKKEPSNSLVSIKHPQVPFFDSNLTSFLKDSLEGNSYILLLACVSPSEADYTETLQTLNYASQARYKKGYHEERPDELCYLNTQLYQLKNEVVALRDIHSNRYLEDQVKTLRDEMNSIRSYIHSLTDELIQAKTDKDALVIQLNSTNKTTELNPVIQEYAYQVQSLKLQVAETRMELEAANNVLRQTSENTNKWVPNSASTSHLYDLEKCNLKHHHTTASSERRPIKRKHTFKVKAAFLPSHRHKEYNDDLTNNADEFMDSLQNESKDEKVLHEDIQQTFEDFSFPLFENHSTSFEDINKELRIPSPPYIRSSSPSNNSILLDGEEDTLEALAVPAWSDEVKDEVKDDTTKRTSISVDSMWDDTDSSITTSYNNSSTADIPIITSSTTENMLKGDRKQKKKLLKMLHQVQADSLVKRELVGRLEKTEDLYTQMRTTYEDKLNKLKEHLLEVQKERDVALSRKPMSPVASTPIRERPQSGLQLRENRQASELRLEYEVKVKNLIAENQALRKKNTQITQASRTTQVKADSFIRQLQADIETLNAQKKQLTKNIKAETDSAKEASSQYEREIQQLKRREITALEAKKKLEEANEVQNQLITKRSEETAAANAQVRKLINTLRKAANAGTFLNEANLEKILDGTFVPTPTNVPSRRSTVNSTD